MRWFATRYPDRRGGSRVVRVDDVNVRQLEMANQTTPWRENEGVAAQTFVQPRPGQFHVRIGNPNRTLTGTVRYTINYRVRGALTDFESGVSRTELYWNAVPSEWATPIPNSRVALSFPLEAHGPPPELKAFVGSMGSPTGVALKGFNGKAAGAVDRLSAQLERSKRLSGSRAEVRTARPLARSEGITVALAMSKGTVNWLGHEASILREPTPTRFTSNGSSQPIPAYQGREGANAFVFENPWSRPAEQPLVGLVPAGIGLALILLLRWLLGPPNVGPIVTRFDPPEGIGPAESGVLVDQTFHVHDLVAGIVALAQKGAVRLKGGSEDGEKELAIEIGDWHKIGNLSPLEWEIAGKLTDYGTTVRPSLLYGAFGYSFGRIASFAAGWVRSEGYLRLDPGVAQIGASVLTVCAVIAATILTFRASPFIAPIAGFVGAIAGLVAFRGLNPMTRRGARALNEVLGVREFILRARKEEFNQAIQASGPQDLYERLLPYAIAFGMGAAWTRHFEGLAVRPPQWYEPGEPGLLETGSLLNLFDRDLDRSESFWAAAQYQPRPQSSWTDFGGSSFGSGDSVFDNFGSSGGSSFGGGSSDGGGGGGSVGGGGGGGGGDSW